MKVDTLFMVLGCFYLAVSLIPALFYFINEHKRRKELRRLNREYFEFKNPFQHPQQ